MSKSYDEIMEEIQVTDEMRDRILQNIAKTDIQKKSPVKKNSHFYRWQKYSLTAACLALLLVGAATLPRLWSGNRQDASGVGNQMNTEELVSGSQWGPQECSSAEALSETVGFSIENLEQLPFTVQETNYIYLGDGLAEIRYHGAGEERLDYRKSAGEEDNSGVYLEFDRVQEEEVNAAKVTLKGDADRTYLILWQKDGFSYSIYTEEGIPTGEAAEWLDVWIR